jgi:hypothetical protein
VVRFRSELEELSIKRFAAGGALWSNIISETRHAIVFIVLVNPFVNRDVFFAAFTLEASGVDDFVVSSNNNVWILGFVDSFGADFAVDHLL